MRVHLDVLGWLYVLSGVFGILTGLSLAVLAFGTTAALAAAGVVESSASATVWLLAICGAAFLVGGMTLLVVGRDLVSRGRFGRKAALVVAVPTLLFIPFGTALGIYTFWTLLNDDARHEFGRPPRGMGGARGAGMSTIDRWHS